MDVPYRSISLLSDRFSISVSASCVGPEKRGLGNTNDLRWLRNTGGCSSCQDTGTLSRSRSLTSRVSDSGLVAVGVLPAVMPDQPMVATYEYPLWVVFCRARTRLKSEAVIL